jgi:hypothetical protein
MSIESVCGEHVHGLAASSLTAVNQIRASDLESPRVSNEKGVASRSHLLSRTRMVFAESGRIAGAVAPSAVREQKRKRRAALARRLCKPLGRPISQVVF